MADAQITILPGTSFSAQPGDTLLRAALRAGLGFPYECNSGGCGSCQFELVDGDVADRWPAAPGLSSAAREHRRRLACQAGVLGECTIKVRLKAVYQALHVPQRQRAVLQSRHWLSDDMLELTFQASAPADFAPGQFAMLKIPGVPAERAYSMSNLPNCEGRWAFIVRKVPGGAGSTALSDDLAIGASVEIDGAYGLAHYRPEVQRDLVCVGGGSGLSPMMSILSAAVRDPALAGRNVHLFYGARTPRDLCIDELFARDPMLRHRVEVHPVLSHLPNDSDWPGRRGFVHQALADWLDQGRETKAFEFYMCGPPPMIDAVRTLLIIDRRVPSSQLHFDRFL